MTREEARKAAEVMMAYANGEEIEAECLDGKYRLNGNPSFNWKNVKYRIKPKITYRPFKDKEECWNEMLKHQPFGAVSSKNTNVMTFICYISVDSIQIHDGCTFHGWNFNYEEMFDKYIFADGTPFGIKED